MMRLPCLCVCTGTWTLLSYRTLSVTDDERAVPVSAGQQERWWVCRACVCTGTWTLLSHPTPPHPPPPVTDHEEAVPVSAGQQERWWGCRACVCTGTWTILSHHTPPHPTTPHPTGNWWWKSSACVCRTARMRLPCLCVYRNMNVIIPPHPTPPPPHRWLMMKEQCLCLRDSKKDDEVAVPVCVQEHERYCPTPPHHTPPVTDDKTAVPVSAGQHERWWGCRACVCTGTWTLLSHPTPPHR